MANKNRKLAQIVTNNFYGIHVTVKHTGKMEDMVSISTSTMINERCRKNAQIKGSICEHCYSETMSKRFPSMNGPLIRNTEILTGSILDIDRLPIINAPYIRFEAFGDVNNAIQVINYFNIAKVNSHAKCAVWTKNPDIYAEAIEAGYKKPDNLIIILSSLFINEERACKYDFIDKVFTVYDKKFIAENNIEINCGAKHCASCLICYEKNDIRQVNEKVK